jgi:hypothetical protein
VRQHYGKRSGRSSFRRVARGCSLFGGRRADTGDWDRRSGHSGTGCRLPAALRVVPRPVHMRLTIGLRLRQWLQRRQHLVRLVRAGSALWWLGPWRPLLLKHYRRHNRNPRLDREETSLFPNLDTATALNLLNRDGYAGGIQLADSGIAQILLFSGSQDVRLNPHLDCAAVRGIAHDPILLEVVKGYIGAEPILYSSRLWWTRPPVDNQQREQSLAGDARFHYDVGDFKTLTVFVYLTDVDENSAPHQVIIGTHLRKAPLHFIKRHISDRHVNAAFQGRVKTIVGRRGTGFFEDLNCFHRRLIPRNPRLILMLTYLLHRTPTSA